MAVPPATALHMGYSCMIPACQHYPAMLLPLALSHLESSACISAEGSVSHSVCGSQTVSLQKERKGKERQLVGCRNWRGIQGARYSSAELMHLGHTAGLMPLLPVGGVDAAGWGHWLPLEAVQPPQFAVLR